MRKKAKEVFPPSRKKKKWSLISATVVVVMKIFPPCGLTISLSSHRNSLDKSTCTVIRYVQLNEVLDGRFVDNFMRTPGGVINITCEIVTTTGTGCNLVAAIVPTMVFSI
jgi:hypothetical protein